MCSHLSYPGRSVEFGRSKNLPVHDHKFSDKYHLICILIVYRNKIISTYFGGESISGEPNFIVDIIDMGLIGKNIVIDELIINPLQIFYLGEIRRIPVSVTML